MVYDKPVPLPIFEGYEVRNGIAVDVVLVRMDPGVCDVEQYGWIAQVLVRLDQV